MILLIYLVRDSDNSRHSRRLDFYAREYAYRALYIFYGKSTATRGFSGVLKSKRNASTVKQITGITGYGKEAATGIQRCPTAVTGRAGDRRSGI